MRHFEENATLYQTEPGQSSLGYWFVFINVQINLGRVHIYSSLKRPWIYNDGQTQGATEFLTFLVASLLLISRIPLKYEAPSL